MMQQPQAYYDDAVFLFQVAAEDGRDPLCFFDEADNAVHTYDGGELQVDTDFTDYRYYALRLDGGQLSARLRFRGSGDTDGQALDDEDSDDLAQRLKRMADQVRTAERVRATDLRPLWRQLMGALFPGVPFGKRGFPTPRLDKSNVAGSVRAALAAHHRLVECEWQAWNEDGLAAVNTALMPLLSRPIQVPAPAQQEVRQVFASDDLSEAVLGWFDCHLRQHGKTLIALSPFDEHQAFALVDLSTLGQVRELLQGLRVDSLAAACIHA